MVRTDKQPKIVSKKLASWKNVNKGLLKTRIYDFVSDLENEGIWHNITRKKFLKQVLKSTHILCLKITAVSGSSIYAVKNKSLLSKYPSDIISSSIAAYNGKTLKGAGDMKIRLADGSVGILKDVFHNEDLNANSLSTNLFTPFHHGIVDNKLSRFDTGDTIGYLRNGTPEVQVEISKLDGDVKPTLPEKPPKSPFFFSRSYQPIMPGNVRGNELEGFDVEPGDEEATYIPVNPVTGDYGKFNSGITIPKCCSRRETRKQKLRLLGSKNLSAR